MNVDISLLQAVIFIIVSIFLLISSFGQMRYEKMPHILYARLHILGVIDFACILALVAFGKLPIALVALLYFIITPVAVHSIAKAHYEGGAGDDY